MNVIFARYNRHRQSHFQIETSINELNGTKTVTKKALTPESAAHIQAINSGYDLVQSSLNAGNLALPSRKAFDTSSISFEYIEGNSLDSLLFEAFRADDRENFLAIIGNYRSLLKKSFRLTKRFEINPKIKEVFGINSPELLGGDGLWMSVAAIDAVFENIIVSGNKHYLIDIEWVFAGVIPLEFVVFRSLFYFHRVKYYELSMDKWISFEELLSHCQINPESAKRYHEMDENFQAYVYGPERCYKYKENYQKRQIPLHSLERTIEHQRNVVRKYHGEIVVMRKELAERDRIINEIVNSFGWRLWLKLSRAIAFLCPAGSRRRRAFDRLANFLKAR